MPVDEQTRPILERMGVPSVALDRLLALHDQERQIRHEDYRPDRERERLSDVRAQARSDLDTIEADDVARAERERDEALDALATEEREASALPHRGMAESTDAYAVRVTAVLVGETRRLQALQLATLDAAWLTTATDPEAISGLLGDVLRAGEPTIVSRLGRQVESRLATLATEEHAKSGSYGNAFQAHAAAQQQLRTWRAAHAASSIEGRRAVVRTRYEARVGDIRHAMQEAARVAGLDQVTQQRRTA